MDNTLILFLALFALVFITLVLLCVGVAASWKGATFSEPGQSRGATALPTEPEPFATVIDESRSWTHLAPTGRETFFPKAPHANPIYELKFTGVLQDSHGCRADAFHKTDQHGNFRSGTDWLRINGLPMEYLDHEFVKTEQCDHHYVLHVAAFGDRLTLALHRGWTDDPSWSGALVAEVMVLPPGTLTARQRRGIEHKQAEEERKRALASEEAALEAAEFALVVKDVTVRAETLRNWNDPKFREKFARVHAKDLIEHDREIREEAKTLLQQDRLIAHLNRHAPAVIEALLGRFHALRIAENLVLDHAIAALEAQKPVPIVVRPKRRLSAEDVKALKVRRQQIELGDKVALAMDRAATKENVKIHVRKEFGYLPEDEQDRIIQEIVDQIDDEEAQSGTTL